MFWVSRNILGGHKYVLGHRNNLGEHKYFWVSRNILGGETGLAETEHDGNCGKRWLHRFVHKSSEICA